MSYRFSHPGYVRQALFLPLPIGLHNLCTHLHTDRSFHLPRRQKYGLLRDINTFTSFSKEKNEDFSSNQVIRVLDQHAIDIARLFNKTYLGKEPNDDEGRMALWGDIVAYEKEMQRIRAITNFKAEDVPIPTMGQSKETVLSEYAIQPVICMEKLYMNIIVA